MCAQVKTFYMQSGNATFIERLLGNWYEAVDIVIAMIEIS